MELLSTPADAAGFLFEFKRRFTLVKVLSGKLVGKKISIYDLLKILLLFKEFQYSEKFLNLLIQKKIV